MARDKATETNIDGSDIVNYPNKRIKDNTGAGNGTPVNEKVYGDIHEFFAKLMRDAGINYSGQPDNVTNGYQLVDALYAFANKNVVKENLTLQAGMTAVSGLKLGKMKVDEVTFVKG